MNRIRHTARNVAQLLLLWLALPNIGASSEPAQQPIHPTSMRAA